MKFAYEKLDACPFLVSRSVLFWIVKSFEWINAPTNQEKTTQLTEIFFLPGLFDLQLSEL